MFIATRPLHKWTPAIEWQAARGHDRIGPVRQFDWEAYNDLPDDAKFGLVPATAMTAIECTHYRCDDAYRLAPVPAKHLPFNASSFKPREAT